MDTQKTQQYFSELPEVIKKLDVGQYLATSDAKEISAIQSAWNKLKADGHAIELKVEDIGGGIIRFMKSIVADVKSDVTEFRSEGEGVVTDIEKDTHEVIGQVEADATHAEAEVSTTTSEVMGEVISSEVPKEQPVAEVEPEQAAAPAEVSEPSSTTITIPIVEGSSISAATIDSDEAIITSEPEAITNTESIPPLDASEPEAPKETESVDVPEIEGNTAISSQA